MDLLRRGGDSAIGAQITARQNALRASLTTRSRYPTMGASEKATYERLTAMRELYSEQLALANSSVVLGEHLLAIYDSFLCQLRTLLDKVNEFGSDPLVNGPNGIPSSCSGAAWCEEVSQILRAAMEYPSHQYFQNTVLFVNPATDFDFSQAPTAGGIFPTKNYYPADLFSETLTFSAKSGSHSATAAAGGTSSSAAIAEAYCSSHCTAPAQRMCLLADTWTIRNLDNSLHTLLGPDMPSDQLRMFDPCFLCNRVSSAYLTGSTTAQSVASDIAQFANNVRTYASKVSENRSKVRRDVQIVRTIEGCTTDNLAYADAQLKVMDEIDPAQIESMIYAGQELKKELRSLPSTAPSNIFTFRDVKRISASFI